MSKTQPSRYTGKKYIARAQREAEQQRRILLVLGAIGLLIVFVLALGLIRAYVLIPRQPVAIVEGVEMSTADYRKRVLYEQLLIDEQLGALQAQFAQLQQAFGDNQELLSSLQTQTEQQMQQLLVQRSGLDQVVLEMMIEEELVIQEAARRSIIVSDEEVSDFYNARAAGRENGFTQADADATVTSRTVALENATATAALFTPTPTLTTTTGAEEAATPLPTVPPPPTPTINVLSGDVLAQAIANWENTVLDNTNMSPDDLRKVIYHQLLRDKLMEAIGDEADTVALQTHARHILVATEEEALQVKARLDGGEAFEALAEELSTDPGSGSQGGDLGWFTRETMVPEFGEAAFTQEIGVVGDPVESQFGWHLIEVLEREERDLEGADLSRARRNAYDAWLVEVRAGNIENRWTPDSPPSQVRER